MDQEVEVTKDPNNTKSDLKIRSLTLSADNSRMHLVLEGNGSIATTQFPGLIRLMKAFRFDQIGGNHNDGWNLSRSEEMQNQVDYEDSHGKCGLR